MTTPNYALLAIAEQDAATRDAFARIDLLTAQALGFGNAERREIVEPVVHEHEVEWNESARAENAVRDHAAVADMRLARVDVAKDFVAAMLANPNARGTVAEMAEWAVLAVDVLFDKLATQRAVRMTPAANGDGTT
jgi:hypothetical protein